MWDFEHAPRNTALAERYQIHYTQPALCAEELLSGRADLGLIPIASLTPELAIVPGCTIASLDRVRSIQLIVKLPRSSSAPASDQLTATQIDRILANVRSIAADTASRSSLAYTQLLFRRFLEADPAFIPRDAEPVAMLTEADAALLIGDPALLALEQRDAIEREVGPCLWIDIAHTWRQRTGLPWVAAVWALRPQALTASSISAEQLAVDLQTSRDQGLTHLEDLVSEWSPRIAISPATIRHYLTQNIHYTLTPECIQTIELFRSFAAEASILPPLPHLQFL